MQSWKPHDYWTCCYLRNMYLNVPMMICIGTWVITYLGVGSPLLVDSWLQEQVPTFSANFFAITILGLKLGYSVKPNLVGIVLSSTYIAKKKTGLDLVTIFEWNREFFPFAMQITHISDSSFIIKIEMKKNKEIDLELLFLLKWSHDPFQFC